uniref:FERM domain-containing protein 8 n=1 Tax=Parascaris univalens TaxID=6257 RepID=A0A915BUK1_PARUN
SKVLSHSLSTSRIHMNRSANRKLSESRGVKIPDITIKPSSDYIISKSQTSSGAAQKSKRKQVSYSDQQQAGTSQEHSDQTTPNSPPLTSSPVGYTLRHPGPLTADSSAKVTPQSATPPLAQLNDAIDITVFLADQRGYKFALVGGKVSTASDLMYLMSVRLGIDAAVLQDTCALWMISDLLEVQLKPHHIPYEVRRSWAILLKRFTQAELDEIIADEPLIVLKRNVQLSVESEIELEDDYESLTEILYVGAKKEVLAGRYLCDLEMSMRLAALQMAIELGPYDPLEHSADFISNEIPSFFPLQYRHSLKTVYLFGFPVIGCKGLENDILEEYQAVSLKYGSNHSRRKAYLNILRSTPFYGAAFFRGQVERPPAASFKELKKMLLAAAMPEIEVFLGINRDYVTVIDPSKHELLLVQPLSNCSWRRVDVDMPRDQHVKRSPSPEVEDLPCFLLHFPDDSENSDRIMHSNSERIDTPEKSKLLQVFSRQAVMMEALMTALYTITLLEAKEVSDLGDELSDGENIDVDQDQLQAEANMETIAGGGQSCQGPLAAELTDAVQRIATNNDQTGHNSIQKGLRQSKSLSPVGIPKTRSPQKHDTNSVRLGKSCRTSSPLLSPTFFASNFSKLCLATFDANGKCVEAQGSLRRVLQEA